MTMRPDISDKIVHFTSGSSEAEAFGNLYNIIMDGRINPSARNVRGGHECVCFTEAPLTSMPGGLVNPSAYSRYSPFGIIYDKQWAFAQGVRPVIYQPDDEYHLLSPNHQWRHVRYEPHAIPPIDFTWEREWRIQGPMPVSPEFAAIVVPQEKWADILISGHNEQQDYYVYEYSQAVGVDIAEQYRENFPWRIYIL